MSSTERTLEISVQEMEMIRAVLRAAGYSPDILVEGRRKFNTATLLLMRMVLSGEADPQALAGQLERSFGRPLKDKVLFASILPRHAIQGLPHLRGTAALTISAPFRSREGDLQEWENEDGLPDPISHRGSLH